MLTSTYSIPNISCMHCVNTIKIAISSLEGVDFVDANMPRKELLVEYDAPASDEIIRQKLESIGYPAG
ncbi:MAG TPA: heavy-metal-associated domain-containing protein [Chloroflexi bacterium]|nr:heavy-metal-associated domain-containing protein [Chloroflexota bacterium]